MKTIVDLAREFALIKHGQQMYGDKPYAYHLRSVYEKVKRFKLGTEAEAVAWLHDVAEDTGTSITELRYHFGETISDAVHLLTNKANFDVTLSGMRLNRLATNVKVCDRICNMEESIGMGIASKYIKQHPIMLYNLDIHHEMKLELQAVYLVLAHKE